jgi:hypothetical protein
MLGSRYGSGVYVIGGQAMTKHQDRSSAAERKQLDTVLEGLMQSGDINSYLQQVLDVAITITGAKMGTLQRFDEEQ